MEIRDTRYAKTPDGVYMAYQTSGKGPIDLVWQFDFLGDVVEAARVEGGQPFKRTVWSTTR